MQNVLSCCNYDIKHFLPDSYGFSLHDSCNHSFYTYFVVHVPVTLLTLIAVACLEDGFFPAILIWAGSWPAFPGLGLYRHAPFGLWRSLIMKTGGSQLQVHRALLFSNTGSGVAMQINTISVAHVNNRHWSTNKQWYTITIARKRTGLPKVTEWWNYHGGKACCGSFVCAELIGAWCPDLG